MSDWVDCPSCGSGDMRREPSGRVLCTNLSCGAYAHDLFGWDDYDPVEGVFAGGEVKVFSYQPVGETLAADPRPWAEPWECDYRWQRLDGREPVDIDGAQGQSYTVSAADAGCQIRVVACLRPGVPARPVPKSPRDRLSGLAERAA